ncbi:hypothetical protein D3C80_1805660 [compost metagenome]
MVSSASRRVAWWVSSRLIAPKSESWRDSAMRRPKFWQLLAWAEFSSRVTAAEVGMRCSGLSRIDRLRPASRNCCCGFRPRWRATSR